MSDAPARHYRFEAFRLDTHTRELRDGDGPAIPLTAKAFDTLCFLIENRHRVVSKDELLATVWAGRVVEENNLTQAISALRRAFGTNAGDHRYIVTVPGRGYRFVAEVEDAVEAATISANAPAPATWHRRTIAFGALLFMLGLFAVAAWRLREPSSTTPPPPQAALAVLPFRSLSPGPRDELLELGMAETLIARLSRSTSMRVLSLGSMQAFIGTKVDPLRAGTTLGADYVIEGSTQQRGDSIRVNVRLLSLPDGRTVWAGTYDQAPERVFSLQDVLATEVSSALSLKYAAGMPYRSPCDGSDAMAYRAYLRGRYLANRPDAMRLSTALAAFREAIDRDPACARAWAGTAFAYRALVMTGDRDPRALFPLAKAAVEKALAIDPDSAEAYASKGFIEFWYDWDWARSEASLRHAIALDGNLAEAHFALAHLLNNIGRPEEAAPQARLAALLDPLSPIVNTLAAAVVGNAGHVEEARQRLENVLELEPDFWVALLVRGGMAMGRRDYANAIIDLRRASELCGDCSQVLIRLGQAYALAGDRGAAERVLHDMELRDRVGYMPPTSLAVLHNALGDSEGALNLLEQGYRERDVRMSFLKVDRWTKLHGQPRFQLLMQRMNFAGDRALSVD
jgi:DNA-binding winged helix-turn-helix (wHTH) protein/TolB-like protein/Flp pilus assembly protein TadD